MPRGASAEKHAVRYISQHQLAYNKRKPVRRRNAPKAFLFWALLSSIAGLSLYAFLHSRAYEEATHASNVTFFLNRSRRAALLRGNQSQQVRAKTTAERGAKTEEEGCSTPVESRKRYFAQPPSAKFATALRQKGWRAAKRWEEAEVLWYHQKSHIRWDELRCWQAVNHLRLESMMSHKGRFYMRLRDTNASAYSLLPETYALWQEAARFRRVVFSEEQTPRREHPAWVLKRPTVDGGKSVEVVNDARTLFTKGNDTKMTLRGEHEEKIAQRYVGDLLLLDGHKFDLRMYWCVARTAPQPLVLFHDGTLRVSLTKFDAPDGGKGQHLTNAAQQAGGHGPDSDERSRQPMSALWDLLERERRHHPDWPANPRAHVECQIRQAAASIWQAFADPLLKPANQSRVFSLLGLDIMLDTNLKLFISEIQSGPGLPSNTRAVADVVNRMVPALADIVSRLHTSEGGSSSFDDLPLGGFEILLDGSHVRQSSWCPVLR